MLIHLMFASLLLADSLLFVDPTVGTEGVGSEYGGMMPMTGVPFGAMHLVPVTRTNAVGRTSFNALDKDLLGFCLTRQPAIWMGEFGPVRIWLDKPLPIESIDAHPWQTTVKAGGKTYELAASQHGALIRSDDPFLGANLADEGVTTERTVRVSTKPIPNFACRWSKRRVGNMLAVGVSLISSARARRHMPACSEAEFRRIVGAAKASWRTFFDRVSIEADETVRRIFYTGLYHALLYPRDLSEEGFFYSAVDDKVHEGPGYSCFSLWDTYRSEHPLLTLVAPERAGAMCQSLVDMYRWGGWLPVWPNPGYTGVMIGDPAAIVLSEAYVKGVKGFDAEAAFAACLKNADVPQPDDATRTWLDVGKDEPGCPETRGGLTWYLKNGYVAHDRTVESVSRTLDYSLADASISKFAAALGKSVEARRFSARGKNYTNLWCAARQCFLPKTLDGKWVTDLAKLTWDDHAYTETNERSARWCVPHDVEGLVALMGGPEAFERELDRFFEDDFYKTDTVGNASVHGNETCHHVAYLYNRIGRYDKTCRRVHDIQTRCYSDSRRGFDGNEDCGAMSAWYILSALGFYPVDPASGEYELGSPIVDGATLRFGEKTLRIVVRRAKPGDWRTVRVSLNGRELADRRVAHADLMKGGALVFEMAGPDSAAAPVALGESFRNPPPGYGEVPFWWWTGDKLDKRRIAEQLEELHAKGVSGTQVNYSHQLVNNWATVPVDPPIFSEAWWDVFTFAAEKSAALGMGIGLSGYTLDWPGADNLYRQLGISCDELRGRVLTMKDGKVVPEPRNGTLDPLNPESAKRVIDRFFMPFWEKVPESAHGALDYFFQDELRLAGNSFVWSDDFPAEFKKRKGYDIVPEFVRLLFAKKVTKDVERVRLDYNDVMVALTEERYFKPIYDWHASRGKIYACDSATRGKDPIEFGDYMRSMRWYTAPGFDTPGKDADPVKCKMGSSISHLYRRPRVWLEGYHSQGWQANTASIFNATAHNYVYGANLLNLHGLYYATYGSWWEWAPPCYHFHQPYWALMGTTLKYFERLSYMLTRGTHVCDVAIVTPQEPCVVDPERANRTSVPLAHALVERLAVNGTTDCDFIDSDSILNATIEKDADGVALSVAGEVYRVVILPDMFVMRPKVRAKLDEFAAAGGRVIEATKADDVKLPLVEKSDVVGNKGLKYHHRRLDDCDIYYFVDWDGQTPIQLRAKGQLEYWDLWTGEKRLEPPTGEPILAVVKNGEAESFPLQNKESVISIRRGELAASTLNVAGPWTVSFLPTMDNKWGDYRIPAFDAKIGPEVRTMRWVEENRTENLTYGPQYFSTSTSTFNLYSFSWRYGVFDKPGNQNDHHGLNRVISDYFFVMGSYSTGWPMPYDITPTDADLKRETRYTTFVYAPYDLQAKIEGGTERAQAIDAKTAGKYAAPTVVALMVGDKPCKVGETVSLKKGYTPVAVTYRGAGRAALVFADVTVGRSYRWPTPLPLAMKWNALGNRLNYDPFGGKHQKGTFVASVPPGTVDAIVDVNGKLLKKEIKDGQLTLEIGFKPGLVGGNAFNDVVKLVTKPAEMALGDWARYEGLRCYSGGAVYRKTVEVPAAFRKNAKHIVLDLGAVGCAASVAVNGKVVGARTCPPWTLDVTEALKDGANELVVTVYNTLNNHYQTIPTRYKVPTTEAPSGLLGPVSFVFVR